MTRSTVRPRTEALTLRQENERLRALLEFNRRVTRERNLGAQLRLVCAELRRATGSLASAVVLRDPVHGVFAVETLGLSPSADLAWQHAVRTVLHSELELLPADLQRSGTFELRVREELVGRAFTFDPIAAVLTPDDVRNATRVIDSAAIAILNARLYAESNRELGRRNALSKVVASISSELDLDSLFGRVLAGAVELLEADSGVISLIDSDGNARVRAVHNLEPGFAGHLIAPGEGITGQVLLARQAMIVDRYTEELPYPLIDSPNVESGVAVPVWWQDRMIGVFGVMASARSRLFNAQDREIMELLGSHVAIALENARLYREARDRLAEVAGLQAATTAIAEELHPERALRVLAEQALSLSGAAQVSIELLAPNGRELEVNVAVGENAHASAPPPTSDSQLVLPLRARGRTLGRLSASTHHPDAFHPRQVELLATFARQAAISLDNAQLYGELQSRLEEMVGLQRLGTLLLEEHDFDRVLQSICLQLQRLTDAGGVGIALLEEDPRYLEMRTVVGPSADALRGLRIPTEGSFAAEALRTNRPQRSNDAQNDPRGYKKSLALGNTRTILSVPMKTRLRTVGILSVYNKEGEGGFTDRDAELATFFANQAAAAIENARLYEQTREYAVVEERNRLARELHDSVTQSLFSVTLLSEAALNLLERDPSKARERLERANELAQGALAEMRVLIFQLRPMTLQEEGLLSALKKHVSALASRHGRVVDLQVTGSTRRVAAPIEDAAFRIIQESLNNVIKHAGDEVSVQVQVEFDTDWLRLSTVDSGVGFDPSARRSTKTLGMSSMRERAEAVGGTLLVDSAPGQGTRVSAELPLRIDPDLDGPNDARAMPGPDGSDTQTREPRPPRDGDGEATASTPASRPGRSDRA